MRFQHCHLHQQLVNSRNLPPDFKSCSHNAKVGPRYQRILRKFQQRRTQKLLRKVINLAAQVLYQLLHKRVSQFALYAVRLSRGKFCNNRNFSLLTFCTIANQRAPIRSRDKLLRASRVVAVEKTIGKLPSRRLVAAKIYFRRSFRNFKSVLSDKFPNQGCLPTCLLYLVFAK